jgi:hypothetical protein
MAALCFVQGFQGRDVSPPPWFFNLAHNSHKRVNCRRCGKNRAEVGNISWGGNCTRCGEIAALENVNGLRAHSGPAFSHYVRRMRAAFGVVLDEPPRAE